MNLATGLITLANSGGIIFGIYSLVHGMMTPNPYHLPQAEFIVGPTLIVICSIWIGLSFMMEREDNQTLANENAQRSRS